MSIAWSTTRDYGNQGRINGNDWSKRTCLRGQWELGERCDCSLYGERWRNKPALRKQLVHRLVGYAANAMGLKIEGVLQFIHKVAEGHDKVQQGMQEDIVRLRWGEMGKKCEIDLKDADALFGNTETDEHELDVLKKAIVLCRDRYLRLRVNNSGAYCCPDCGDDWWEGRQVILRGTW